MEIATMGRVTVEARISNFQEAFQAKKGLLPAGDVRSIQVADALVDTGALLFSMPNNLIQDLGLVRQRTRTARTAAGVLSFEIYEPVALAIQGRECVVEVAELPDDCPVLIGQVPLELLDFVADPARRCLVGNPEYMMAMT